MAGFMKSMNDVSEDVINSCVLGLPVCNPVCFEDVVSTVCFTGPRQTDR